MVRSRAWRRRRWGLVRPAATRRNLLRWQPGRAGRHSESPCKSGESVLKSTIRLKDVGSRVGAAMHVHTRSGRRCPGHPEGTGRWVLQLPSEETMTAPETVSLMRASLRSAYCNTSVWRAGPSMALGNAARHNGARRGMSNSRPAATVAPIRLAQGGRYAGVWVGSGRLQLAFASPQQASFQRGGRTRTTGCRAGQMPSALPERAYRLRGSRSVALSKACSRCRMHAPATRGFRRAPIAANAIAVWVGISSAGRGPGQTAACATRIGTPTMYRSQRTPYCGTIDGMSGIQRLRSPGLAITPGILCSSTQRRSRLSRKRGPAQLLPRQGVTR